MSAPSHAPTLVTDALRALWSNRPFVLNSDDVPLLAAHKLAPWVWAQAERLQLGDNTKRELRLYVMASVARWAEVEQDAQQALLALGACTPVIPMRALDYATSLYASRELRPFNDLDVLVPAHKFAEAAMALHTLGYRVIHNNQGVAGHAEHYAWQFVKGGLSIDLHRAARQAVRAKVDYAAIFSRATPSSRFGAPILQADPIDQLLLHIAHQAGHEFVGPLIAFVDLHALLARVDLADAQLRAASFGLSNALQTALQLRLRLLGAPFARGPSAWLWPSLARQNEPSYQVFRPLQLLRKAALLDDWTYRLRFARYALAARSSHDESVSKRNNL